MHDTCLNWAEKVIGNHLTAGCTVLEIGSLNVNGSVRPFFKSAAEYIGTDMQNGPGVDSVVNAHSLPYQEKTFDWVVCTEMFEHDSAFWISLQEMGRVLKSNGLLLLTARGNGFPPHGYPQDYWRFMPDSVSLLFDLANCDLLINEPDPVPGFLGLGRKRQ